MEIEDIYLWKWEFRQWEKMRSNSETKWIKMEILVADLWYLSWVYNYNNGLRGGTSVVRPPSPRGPTS